MPKRPGLFLYRDAWLAEQSLVTCSENARYLWIMMLMLMNENEPRGYLVVNGKPLTPHQLAVMTMTDPTMIEERLAELESAGVFSRDRRGVIFSRRMIRESRKARIAQENGRKGGNPSLRKQREIPPSDNQSGNQSVKPTSCKLQTQTQESESLRDTDTEEIPLPAAAETPTPHEPKDGATAPAAAGEIVVVPSAQEFELHCLGKVGANPATTRKDIAAWVAAYSAPEVEMAIRRTLRKQPPNPIGYAEGALRGQKNDRDADMETAERQGLNGKPDPNMEADRKMREYLTRMETSNDDDTTSRIGLLN